MIVSPRLVDGERILQTSLIRDEFTGFDDKQLFALTNGSFWIQAEYKYWYHYSYRPQVELFQFDGTTRIRIAGRSESVAVRQVHDVIVSSIRGEFTGWEGGSVYELSNGQQWQQAEYIYTYSYAFQPQAIVFDTGSGYAMLVNGTTASVRRIR